MHLLVLFLSNFAFAQQACLNLNGFGEGPCVYESQKYGKLDGYIDFNFQQSGCNQLTLNGHVVSIPGKLEIKDQQGKTVLFFQWLDQSRRVLSYKYEMVTYSGSQLQDHVILNGHFSMGRSYLQLFQTGTVDQDPVRIQCQLKKWN